MPWVRHHTSLVRVRLSRAILRTTHPCQVPRDLDVPVGYSKYQSSNPVAVDLPASEHCIVTLLLIVCLTLQYVF